MFMVKKHIFYLCMDLCSMTGTCLYYVHCYFQYSALLDYKMKYKRVSPNVTAETKIIHQIHRIVSKLFLNHFLGVFKANIHKNAKRKQQLGQTRCIHKQVGLPRKTIVKLRKDNCTPYFIYFFQICKSSKGIICFGHWC